MALLAWALASSTWSASPMITPRLVVLAGLVIASAAWIGLSLAFREQVSALFLAMHVLTLGSLVAVIVAPSARFSTFINDRSWIGLFGNPNLLAPVATAAVLTIVGAWPLAKPRWRGLLAVLASIDLVIAAKATSVTAWLALGAGCGAIVIATFVRRHVARNESTHRSVVVGFSAAVIASLALAASLPMVARAAGKDETFGGRREIWRYVLSALDGHWIQGYGFGAFWDDPANQFGYMAYSGRGWVASSHSTFVDALVWIGVVGLALLAVVVIGGLARLWYFTLARGGWESVWWSGVGAFALVENLAESMWLLQSTFWVLLLAPGFVAVRLWAGLRPVQGTYPKPNPLVVPPVAPTNDSLGHGRHRGNSRPDYGPGSSCIHDAKRARSTCPHRKSMT